MGLGQIEELIEDSEGTHNQFLISTLNHANTSNIFASDHKHNSGHSVDGDGGSKGIDYGRALQLIFNHIPISSIPGIKNSPVLELKIEDTLRDAIGLLYDKKVMSALIVGAVDLDATAGRQEGMDRYIGMIDLDSMVLWCLQKSENDRIHSTEGDGGFFSMLEQNPQIGQTKVGELAKSFLWDPFFPVNINDTLFHVLLLFSKHKLKVIPVIERSNSLVIGFVTQNAVIQLLLQSSGLKWFDSVANKKLAEYLAEFRFKNEEQVSEVCDDQSVAESLYLLCESRVDAIAVRNPSTGKIAGSLRSSDIHLLLENNNLFNKRRVLLIKDFLKVAMSPRNDTNNETDTLKEAMESMVKRNSNSVFVVNPSNSGSRLWSWILFKLSPEGICRPAWRELRHPWSWILYKRPTAKWVSPGTR